MLDPPFVPIKVSSMFHVVKVPTACPKPKRLFLTKAELTEYTDIIPYKYVEHLRILEIPGAVLYHIDLETLEDAV